MSDTSNIMTIRRLVDADLTQLSEPLRKEFEATEAMEHIQSALYKKLPYMDWQVALGHIFTQIEGLLDKPMLEVLEVAWQKNEAIQQLLQAQSDDDKRNIGQVFSLPEHELRTAYNPILDVQLDSEVLGRLRFFLGVKLDLSNLRMRFDSTNSLEVVEGKASGDLVLQYQNITLIERSFLNKDIISNIKDTNIVDAFAKKPSSILLESTLLPKAASMSEQEAIHLTAHDDEANVEGSRSKLSNFVQFCIGFSIAVLAVLLFWLLQ